MIAVRKSDERGHANHGWLDTYHTFSFADYYDEQFMGYRVLRVINEDRVAPGRGFGTHGHQDMEIVTYVLAGALEHKDSLGNGSVLRAGHVQRMTAGSGIRHSEFNHDANEPVHLYQIWMLPEAKGLTPSYEDAILDPADRLNKLQKIAGPKGNGAVMNIHQDVSLYLGALTDGAAVDYSPAAGRKLWVQVTQGTVNVNGTALEAGDGAAVEGESTVKFDAPNSGEVLIFDMP